MIGQTTELIKEGQTFADRFGWEALVIVVFFGFSIYALWNFGGRLINAVVSYIEVTREQMVTLTGHQGKIAEQQFELSRAITSLAEAKTDIASGTEQMNLKINKALCAMKLALLATESMLPDDSVELKAKLRHIVTVLDE